MFDVVPVTNIKQGACGPTCLRMMLLYYGIDVPLDELIEDCGLTPAGCTGADLLRAGRKYGLDMQAYSIDADELVRQDRPCIVNWKYGHWCVFAGRDEDGNVVVCNPSRGRYRMSEGTFASLFTGLDDHPGQGVAIFAGEPFPLGVADNIPKGAIFLYEGAHYRALAAIPRGEEVIDGVNATAVDVVTILNQLETKE